MSENNQSHKENADADAIQRKALSTEALSEALKKFQNNWATLEPQAKAQLRECWDHDHRKAERRQLLWQCVLIMVLGALWLIILAAMIRCLKGAISDIGKYEAVVLCAFLVVSLSVPATLALFLMKKHRDDD
jgi:ferric-dicitrate binding protein FerR (iron transport regulator)